MLAGATGENPRNRCDRRQRSSEATGLGGDKLTQDPRFLISDDHALFRRGLQLALCDGFPNATVVEATSFDQAFELLQATALWQLASFDLGMPGMQSGRSLRAVRERYPSLPIVVLSGLEDRRTVLSALDHGASGFIPKSLPTDAIIAAFRDVLGGRIYVPPTIVDLNPASHPDDPVVDVPPGQPADLSAMTPRQRDVLMRLIVGRSTKEIGRDLKLAEGTVKIHLAVLFRMLGAHNRIDAVARAVSIGVMPEPPKGGTT